MPAIRLDAVGGMPTLRAGRRSLAPLLGSAALLGLVAGSLAVVIAAAQGGSTFLSPVLPAHTPAWLAGPLHGIWPQRPNRQGWLEGALSVDLAAMLACYVAALACAPRLPARLVWGALIAVHVVFLLSPPLLLTDVFNYIAYARMGVVHGINPYTHLPVAITGDPVLALSNWHHLPSPYGPLFTLATYALAPLGIVAVFWSYKVAVMLASLACLALLWRLARGLGRSPTAAVVLTGLNPFVLVYGLGGEHNDAFTMLLLLGGVLLCLRQRERAGLAAIVAAVALKASAALLAPVAILAGGRLRRTVTGALAAALVLGAATLLAFGPHAPAVTTESRLVTTFSLPNLIGLALGAGGENATVRAVAEALLLAGTAAITLWAWRRRELLAGLGWVTLLTLVTLGWDMAWYVLWLLPFVALVPRRGFRIAAIAVIAFMSLQWLPVTPSAANAVGIRPGVTAQAARNDAYFERLLK